MTATIIDFIKRGKDYLDREGAEELAQRIRAHWSRADKPIKVWVERENMGDIQGRPRYIYVIRSNITFVFNA